LCENLNKNDYYLAVSENTRKDFLKYFPKRIDSEKIRVISLGYDEKFKPYKVNNITTVKRKYGIPENKKYIFSLCTLDPRKNLLRVIKTFIAFVKKNNIDDTVFVLAGGHWEKFLPQLQNAVKELGEYSNRIIRTGYIDDEDLPILYNGAEWFVYTSAYEGFGLPPLEAMACGCPVIVSNNSSLPEVVEDAGIMIDWDNDEQHIAAYEQYYFDLELKKNVAKGFKQAKKFS